MTPPKSWDGCRELQARVDACWHGPQQKLIDKAKEGRGQANAEGECGHRYKREAGALGESASPESNIVD
jgi:hypothetical protein